MAEKVFIVSIPDGYEIDEEKSTFERIVFKELDYKSLYETLKERIQDLHGAGIISDSNYSDLFRKDPPKKKIKSSPKSKITSKSTTSKKIKPKSKKVDEPIGSLFDQCKIPYENASNEYGKCFECPFFNESEEYDLCDFIKNPDKKSSKDPDVIDFKDFCSNLCCDEIPLVDPKGRLKEFVKNNLLTDLEVKDCVIQNEIDRVFGRINIKSSSPKILTKSKSEKEEKPIGSLFDKYGIPYELAYDSTFDKCWQCPLCNREGDHDLCEYIKNPENTSDVIDWEDYEDDDILDLRDFCREVCDNEIPSVDSEGKLEKFLKNNLIKNIPEDFATQGEVDREFERVFGKETTKKKTKSTTPEKIKPKSKSKKVDEPVKSESKVKSEEIKGDYNTFIGWINNCTSFYQHCYEGYTFPTHDGYEVRDFLPEGLGYKEDGVDIPYNDPEGIDSYFEDWFDDFKEDMGDKFMTYTEYLKQLKK